VRIRLPIRPERGRLSRRHERVFGDDVLVARAFGVMHDVGRVGLRGEERREDLGVQAAPRRDGDARSDRIARELVPEAHVSRLDGEQLPALRLLGGAGPARYDRVEDRRRHSPGHERDQLDEAPRPIVEPRCASEDRVRNRRRQLRLGARREQLGHVEGVAARRGVDIVGVAARERDDRRLRQRRELDEDGRVVTQRTDGGAEWMRRRDLARAEGEHDERRERDDAAPEDRDCIERRVVGPVHVLEDEHCGPRRELELFDQEALQIVRGGAVGEGTLERCRDGADQVAQRPEGSRDRQVVAAAEQHPGTRLETADERRYERRLADPRLAGDERYTSISARRLFARSDERGESVVALQQFHGSTIDAACRLGKKRSRRRHEEPATETR